MQFLETHFSPFNPLYKPVQKNYWRVEVSLQLNRTIFNLKSHEMLGKIDIKFKGCAQYNIKTKLIFTAPKIQSTLERLD